jgi:uracil-DNA glycosylase family 4
MDDMNALRLQIEWGADEAYATAPVDRLAPRAQAGGPAARPPRPTGTSTNAATDPARAARAIVATPSARPAQTPAARAEMLAAAATSRDELQRALEDFKECPLSATATNLVFADGNAASGLMLVGEGPGAEEDRAGRPFVGPSGQLLDRMLASVGLDRSRYLITNLIPWRPPGNRNPTDSEVLMCLPFLLRHIALVRPRRMVLLGAIASRAVLNNNAGIRKLRGTWVNAVIPGCDSPILTLPMLHPAYLLRNPGAKRDAWADIVALRRALDADGSG